MKLDSRHILILLGLSLALSSCVQFSAQEGMAQLYPPVFEVDASVEDLTQTKAATPPTLAAPAITDIHFTVKDKDGNTVYDTLGVWDSPLQLPAGAYSIDASSGSNAFGSPYYTGTASGTVAGGQDETPSITMVLQNALLAVGLTENLAQHFTVAGENCITISTASDSIDTGKDEYIYVPSDEALSIAISGTSSAGVDKTITHSLTARSAATATYLSCDMTTTNAPVITMSSNADDYGAWGTVAYIPFASTQNINAENAAKMEYWASSDGINFDIKGEIVKGVNVKFTRLTTGDEYSFCAKIGSITSDIKKLTVAPMPTSIVVTATGTTSYDYYLAYRNGDPSKLEQANNAAPETVSGIGYSVSGIDDKLKQAKFGYSETLKYDDGSVPQNTTKENQSWGKHTVSATVTFAGQTFNGDKDCHITGLPYKKNFTSDKSTEGWSGLSTSNNNKAVCLGYLYGSGTITYNVFSPNFALPSTTAVSYTAVHYYGATGAFSPSGTIYSGITTDNTKTKQASITGDAKYLTTTPTEFSLKDDVDMNNSSKISLSGSCEARKLVQNFVELARIEILYR